MLTELNDPGLPWMSAALDKIPRSPDFIHLDPLMANAKLAEPEYQQKTNKRSQSLLRAAYFRGCPQELSARYGVKLNDGRSFYIQNDGIRTVPPEHVETVLSGGIAPAEVYYCVTKPEFEIYDDSLSDLKDKLFVVNATRFPDSILLEYYMVLIEK